MELALIAIAACLVIGGLAALSSFKPGKPGFFTELREGAIAHVSTDDNIIQTKNTQFSLHNTLLIIGPSANHTACRIQRKLLKPTIPTLIREDISVMEIYGDTSPRLNGNPMTWLDSSLLRHALDAHEGFFVIYVNSDGKTVFRKTSPMLTEMIAERAELAINPIVPKSIPEQSDIIRRLQAA